VENPYEGKIVMSSDVYNNGASHYSEDIKNYGCSIVLVLQAEESSFETELLSSSITNIRNN
jgi:hypothetical protein